jgi:hypothetical protein
MIRSTIRALPIAFAMFGVFGCHHDRPSEHAPGASAPAHELSGAVNDLVDERCDLEERCNHVGSGQTYENREACESKLRGSISNDLNTADCPHGISDAKLDKCKAEIRAESCGDPIEAMSRWNACRQGNICND